jgi:Carbohydrate esterase, sialic acid-specific acetylesterase
MTTIYATVQDNQIIVNSTIAAPAAFLQASLDAAEGFADDAEAAKIAAEAAALETSALATLVTAPTSLVVNGVVPFGIIGNEVLGGSGYSYIAFMPDGSIVSTPIENMISSRLAGVTFESAETDGWDYVLTMQAGDGNLYAVNGRRADGTMSPDTTRYETTALTPLVDAPVFSTTGANASINYGQSLSIGVEAQPAISTAAFGNAFTFGSGVNSAESGNTWGAVNTSPGTSTLIPLVEMDSATGSGGTATGETTCTGAATEFTRRYLRDFGGDTDNCLLMSSAAGLGATTIAGLSKGAGGAGVWYNNLISHMTQGKARFTALSKSYILHNIVWMQGEADASAGTTKAAYKASFLQLMADVQDDYETATSNTNTIHWLIYQTANNSQTGAGTLANLNQIQLAQIELARENSNVHMIGPMYHLPIAADGLHMNNIGQARFARAVGRAQSQLVLQSSEPARIDPISATYTVEGGNYYVTATFAVPQLPLVLDEITIGRAKDYGFKIVDDTGTLTVMESHIIVNGDSVKLRVNRALGANPKLRYALDYLASSIPFRSGASGNLRDSTAGTYTVSGVEYNEWHWSPAFELAVASLENA